MNNYRHKYRIPFFDNSGKFIGFEDLDILKGVQPYNAGVCHRGEPEQCTGLTDKNGDPVFDGDVIQENGINRYIHWHDNGWFYSVRYAPKCHWHLRKEDVENAEIIGTIHDDQFRDLANLMEE